MPEKKQPSLFDLMTEENNEEEPTEEDFQEALAITEQDDISVFLPHPTFDLETGEVLPSAQHEDELLTIIKNLFGDRLEVVL